MAGYSVTFTVVDEATKQIEAINRRIQGMRAPLERMSRQVQRFVDVSGLKKVAEGFESIAKSALGAFESLGRIIPALGAITSAATIAGMVKLVSVFADWGNTLTKNADRIGTSTEKLQALQGATELAGGSVDTMIESLKGLTDAAAGAFTGRNTEALAWFNRAKITLTDANGQLRQTTELLPEVLQYLDSIKNPADRAFAAMHLGGQALEQLDIDLRASGKTLDQWITDYRAKFPPLAREQLDALRRWRLANAELGLTFTHLGQEISATLAEHFAPLLEQFTRFVQQHTPEIIAAVDRISTQFATWLEGIDWTQVQAGLAQFMDALKWIAAHAETIAIIFATKWAIGMVASIASVTTALAPLARLLAPLAVAYAAFQGGKAAVQDPGNIAPGAGIWKSIQNVLQGKAPWAEGYFPTDKTPLAPPPGAPGAVSPPAAAAPPHAAAGPGRMRATPASYTPPQPAAATPAGGPRPATAPAPANDNMQPAGGAGDHAFLRKQEGLVLHPYSDVGHQAIGYGHDFTAAEQRQGFATGASGQRIPIGKITKAQADDLFQADYQSREKQVAKMAGAGWGNLNANQREAVMSYYYNTGRLPRGLAANLQAGDTGAIAGSLEHGISTVHGQPFAPLVKRRRDEAALFNTPPAPTAQGAPAQVTGGPPVSGSVDVNITHRNPPPGTTVTTTGRGDVDVAPLRVEQQQLSAA
jgi:GH24 family phage-related lysozyme (muramidase)